MIKKYLLFGLITLAVSLFLYSCTPDKLTGDIVANSIPTINFTNLPINDSVYSYNATIYWYSEDEDGQVMSYYYLVMLEDSIDGEVDSEFIANVVDTISLDQWVTTEETEVTIQMYASADTSEVLHQYIFVKCQDDDDAFSRTIYYSLFRKNHLPETYLTGLPGANIDSNYVLPVWSLADTNSLWAGSKITWTGDDTLDFPDGAPDFEYEWKIYGPYDTTHYDAVQRQIDITIDNVLEEHVLWMSCADEGVAVYAPNFGETCENTWTTHTDITLIGLPTGCYLFEVRSRDDALVPDESPAWGTFIVIEPLWVNHPELAKDILIVQSTQFSTNSNTAQGWPVDSVVIEDSTLYFPTVLMDYYSEMIEGAGNYSYDIFGLPVMNNAATNFPTVHDLAKYRMVLIDDMDYQKIEYAADNAYVLRLKNYMSVGGKAWIIGRSCMNGGGISGVGLINFDAQTLAVDFFDLSAAIYARPNFSAPFSVPNYGEFIGAFPIHESYDYLEVDTSRTLLMNQYGLNRVEVLIRNSANSTTMYTYNAANPDTMEAFQYMPCAVRYYPGNHVFKSSYFAFPLYMMDNSEGQVQAVFNDMLAWFFED